MNVCLCACMYFVCLYVVSHAGMTSTQSSLLKVSMSHFSFCMCIMYFACMSCIFGPGDHVCAQHGWTLQHKWDTSCSVLRAQARSKWHVTRHNVPIFLYITCGKYVFMGKYVHYWPGK